MKYRRDVPIGEHLHDGEPYFLLRAQDILALPTLAAYAAYLRRSGADDQAREVAAVGVQFAEWQGENAEHVKFPD